MRIFLNWCKKVLINTKVSFVSYFSKAMLSLSWLVVMLLKTMSLVSE